MNGDKIVQQLRQVFTRYPDITVELQVTDRAVDLGERITAWLGHPCPPRDRGRRGDAVVGRELPLPDANALLVRESMR